MISFNRNNYDIIPSIETPFTQIDNFNVDISSSEIRASIKKNNISLEALTSPVINYIKEHNLYE